MDSPSNCDNGKWKRVDVRLRPFRAQDMDRVLEVEGRSFDDQAFSRSQFEEIFRQHPEAFCVAELSGGIAGYILGAISGEKGELYSLAVDPHFRNLGIGRKLVEWLLERFREMDVRTCSLKVRTTNGPAIRLYKKTGFEIVKILDSKGEGDIEAFLMNKTL